MSIEGKDSMDVTARDLLQSTVDALHNFSPPPTRAVVILVNDENNRYASHIIASGCTNMDLIAILEQAKLETFQRMATRSDEELPGETWKQG